MMTEFGPLIQHKTYIYTKSRKYEEEHCNFHPLIQNYAQGNTYSRKLKTESIFKEHERAWSRVVAVG
jgi:hypothetical protein